MNGLVKRGGVWIYRRRVPVKLRSIIGTREIKRSLGTGEKSAALARWRTVNAEVDQMFAEAMAGASSPAVAAYKAVQGWTRGDREQEEGLDLHLTSLLERTDLGARERTILETLLNREEHAGAQGDKRVKTKSSKRRVPIHPALIKQRQRATCATQHTPNGLP